jgi:D-beta-D-heptose 7-phosphate kinase/D-beta-D-heptose 1-phosphate adenosyltransferase
MARCQPFAPFRAAALENEATALRAHTLAEPMRFGAPAVVRLKSSLHCDAPKVDVVPLFEKRETNNRNLLCQGIDTLVTLAAIHLRWPLEPAMAKILSLDQLQTERERLGRQGRRVVFTNGCFDLIHPGHIRYLQAARRLGDALIVALNSDRSARELKGEKRPILDQNERAEVMAALGCVDYVTIFDETTPREIIAALLPDVLVKGGDWEIDRIVGRDVVEAAGGEVLSLPFVEGCSTTDLIERIVRRYGGQWDP